MNIPNYETRAGNTYKLGSYLHNDIRICVESTMAEECRNYAKKLSENGFTKLFEREIPSSDEYTNEKNLAYGFSSGESAVYLFYDAPIQTLHISALPASAVFDGRASESYENKTEPFYSQINIERGMCNVARLSDGSFLVVDSGIDTEEDRKKLFDFLDRHKGTEIPTVRLWIFTHPDIDHIGLATEFFKEYATRVEISGFAYQFPTFKLSDVSEDLSGVDENSAAFEKSIKENYPKTPIYSLHTGEIYNLPGCDLEILSTIDNLYPIPMTNCNDASIAARLNFHGKKSVMILGDCTPKLCRAIAETYGKYLKSDILQVAHHGLIGGYIPLYAFIDADICLWATPKERFLGELPEKYHWCLGEGGCVYNKYLRDDAVKKRIHYPQSETVVLPI